MRVLALFPPPHARTCATRRGSRSTALRWTWCPVAYWPLEACVQLKAINHYMKPQVLPLREWWILTGCFLRFV